MWLLELIWQSARFLKRSIDGKRMRIDTRLAWLSLRRMFYATVSCDCACSTLLRPRFLAR
jgi:hypothetical protein